MSYDIGKGLVQLGHQVTVVTMAYKDLPSYEKKDGMDIYRVKCLRKEKMVCHPWEQATYILSALHFIKRKLTIKEFDICYTHFIIPTGPIAWWLKKRYHLPYVITSHGSDVIGHNNKRFKLLYALVKLPWCKIVRDAAAVVAPSKYLLELIQSNEKNGNCELIRNGVDTSFFGRGEEKQKKILIMCRLQETKNVQCVIRALEKVDLGEWKVEILGDGPYKEILRQLTKECKLEDKITFRGWVNNRSKEHLQALQEASIYVSASLVENCPTAVLEAASCGANLLLSDIPAHRQMAETLDSDIFFPAEYPEALAEKMQYLIERIEQTDNFENQYDLLPYDWAMVIQKYEELLATYCKKQEC